MREFNRTVNRTIADNAQRSGTVGKIKTLDNLTESG
jgi:hypothetical protein